MHIFTSLVDLKQTASACSYFRTLLENTAAGLGSDTTWPVEYLALDIIPALRAATLGAAPAWEETIQVVTETLEATPVQSTMQIQLTYENWRVFSDGLEKRRYQLSSKWNVLCPVSTSAHKPGAEKVKSIARGTQFNTATGCARTGIVF